MNAGLLGLPKKVPPLILEARGQTEPALILRAVPDPLRNVHPAPAILDARNSADLSFFSVSQPLSGTYDGGIKLGISPYGVQLLAHKVSTTVYVTSPIGAYATLTSGALIASNGSTDWVRLNGLAGPSLEMGSSMSINWGNGTAYNATKDVGLKRSAVNIIQVTDGASGLGALSIGNSAATIVPLLITGFASQSADLLSVQTSAAVNAFKVGPVGQCTIENTLTVKAALSCLANVAGTYFSLSGAPSTAMAGNGSDGNYNWFMKATYATWPVLAIRATAAQSVDIVRILNSSSVQLAAITKEGYFQFPGSLRLLGYTTVAGVPTTTELPNDKDVSIHKNSSDGKVYLSYNDGATVKKVELV